MKSAPYKKDMQSVFNNNVHKIELINVANKVLITLLFRYKNSPKISPVSAEVSVNPIKYGPKGKRMAPIKSESDATIIPPKQPYLYAISAVGKKPSEILMFHAFMTKNVPRIYDQKSVKNYFQGNKHSENYNIKKLKISQRETGFEKVLHITIPPYNTSF